MFKKSVLFLGVLSTLFFMGCTKTSPTNPDREELSSSSGGVASSSSSVNSSSSIDDSKLPEGAKRAVLSDLDKNISLGKLFGGDAYMVKGENGLFSLWFFEAGETTEQKSHGWIVVNSNFEDGIIKLQNPEAAAAFANTTMGNAIQAMVDDTTTISFIKKGDAVSYSINDGDYVLTTPVQVLSQPGYLSKASDIYDAKFSCATGDSAFTIKFFSDGRYVKESSGTIKSLSAGFFDIHRSNLLLRPTYYNFPTSVLLKYKVDSKTFAFDALPCEKVTFQSKAWATEDLVKTWVAVDTLNWSLTINASGSFDLSAESKAVSKERKKGTWERFGSYFGLKANTCLDPKTCSKVVLGEITSLEDGSFTYDHTDKVIPVLPKEWDLATYE